MLAVAIAARRRDREEALVDAVRLTRAGTFAGNGLLRSGNLGRRRSIVWQCKRIGCWQLREPTFKGVLHQLGVGRPEAVLGGERLLRPKRGAISRCDVPKGNQQLLPQRARLLGLEGSWPLAMSAAANLSIVSASRLLSVPRHARTF